MAQRTKSLFARASIIVAVIGAVMAMAATALANVPLTTVSNDPYTTTQNFHRTELEPDTYSFGSTTVAVFQVGRFSDGGANNIGWATTTNNGATWTNGFLPGTTIYATPAGTWARISDPTVAYDAKHDVWMANGLGIDASATGKSILVNRSTTGGTSWTNPVTVSTGGGSNFYDKNWIACDNTATSPNYGNCYIQWDDAFQSNQLRMSRSTDGGVTWSSSSVPSASVIGGQPVTLPNGNVVVPISNAFGSTAQTFISTNGGVSYTGPNTISSIQVHGVAGNLRDGGGLISAEVDGGGTIFVAWHDCRFRSGCNANDIVFSTSTNGTSWTAVKRIPIAGTSSTVDAFIPGIGVDRATSGSTAHVGVTFYFYPQTSCTSTTCKLNAGYISSTNGGASWGSPVKVLGPINLKGLPLTTQGYMVGDYISTSFGSNGKAYPVISNATGSSCVTGNPTACNEPMVAPTSGLAVVGGSNLATSHGVKSLGTSHPTTMLRRF
jgi:hypothetical protein